MASIYPRPSRGGEAHLWLAAGFALVVLACLVVLAAAIFSEASQPLHRARALAAAAAPAPRPDDAAVLLNNIPLAIAPTDAIAINAARALDRVRLTPARPLVLSPTQETLGAAIDCLTQAVYYEAASESDTGQRAVAQVVLNRLRNPLFPHSVCDVVYQGSQLRTGCQFSFTCDGSLTRQPSIAGWARARRVALTALGGWVERSVGLATHYHANFVVPYWASSLDKAQTIGAHIFYIMRGPRGRPASFTEGYDAAAEAAPVVGLTGATLDEAFAPAGTEATSETPGAAPRDRTVVTEDALGALAAPAPAIAPSTSRLAADETKGELMIDRRPDPAAEPR